VYGKCRVNSTKIELRTELIIKIFYKMENTKQQIEKASEYYAHNYFDMHETNSYKELKRGFEAGVEWARKNILIKDNAL